MKGRFSANLLVLGIATGLFAYSFFSVFYPTEVSASKIYTCNVLSDSTSVKEDDTKLLDIREDEEELKTTIISSSSQEEVGFTVTKNPGSVQTIHSITLDEYSIEMIDNSTDMWGMSYSIYDKNTVVATASFYIKNSFGTISDVDGNTIANYSYDDENNSFTVEIIEENYFSNPKIPVLICYKYFSDYSSLPEKNINT